MLAVRTGSDGGRDGSVGSVGMDSESARRVGDVELLQRVLYCREIWRSHVAVVMYVGMFHAVWGSRVPMLHVLHTRTVYYVLYS